MKKRDANKSRINSIDEETQRLTTQCGKDESDNKRPSLKSPCMAAPSYARLQVFVGVRHGANSSTHHLQSYFKVAASVHRRPCVGSADRVAMGKSEQGCRVKRNIYIGNMRPSKNHACPPRRSCDTKAQWRQMVCARELCKLRRVWITLDY